MSYSYKRDGDQYMIRPNSSYYSVRRHDYLVDDNNGIELNIFNLCLFGYSFETDKVLRGNSSDYFVGYNYDNYIKSIEHPYRFLLKCSISNSTRRKLKQERFIPVDVDVLLISLYEVCGIEDMYSTWSFENGIFNYVYFNYLGSVKVISGREFLESSVFHFRMGS